MGKLLKMKKYNLVHLEQKFKFKKKKIKGPIEIICSPIQDHRGFFQRIYCKELFKRLKLNIDIININNSFSKKKGTVRGLHYQIKPFQEDKLIKCVRGKLINYIVDIRRNSKTYLKHVTITLSPKKNNMSFIPRGFANGIQTLEDDTEMIYFTTNYYSNDHERGLNFFDKKLNLKLFEKISNMTEKDKSWQKIS